MDALDYGEIILRRRTAGRAAIAVAAATGLAALAGTTAAAATRGLAPPPAPGGTTILGGSAAPFAATGRALGLVPGTSKLTIQVWLKPHVPAAEAYALAVSTPGSDAFGHFLSPAGEAARFRASAGRVNAVTS